MASPLKIYENKPYLVSPLVAVNGTETQLKQLEFDYSRIAIISVHGDPGKANALLHHFNRNSKRFE